MLLFFFKQKTAYEMRISDWSSDVCSSDLEEIGQQRFDLGGVDVSARRHRAAVALGVPILMQFAHQLAAATIDLRPDRHKGPHLVISGWNGLQHALPARRGSFRRHCRFVQTSEEHTSPRPSLIRTSYAVFCFTNKNRI